MLLSLLTGLVLICSATAQRRDPLVPFLTSGSCGVDKQCIQLPSAGCTFDSCDKLLTWKAGLLNGQSVIVFELTGVTLSVSQSSAYLALAISLDQQRGNDYIIACGWDGTTEFVRYAYQSGTGVVNLYEEPSKGYAFARTPEVYFNPVSSRVACTFAILRDRNPDHPLTKLISGIPLTYFFATGTDPLLTDFPALAESPTSGNGPWYASPDEVPQDSDAWHANPKKSPSVAHRAHAILMLISWMWLASIAIVTARYMKTTLGTSRTDTKARSVRTAYLDGRTWLQIHRALQIGAVVLCAIAFVLIFIVESRWIGSDYPYLPEAAHPILGCIVMALAILNFILGWCAPRAMTRGRCVWNWFHWFFGSATHCIALPTMLIGMSLKNWPWYLPVILFIWVIFHVIVELLLEILACCGLCCSCFKSSKKKDVVAASKDDAVESKALVFQNSDGRRVFLRDDNRDCACPAGSTCRIIIWAVHIAVTSILAIVLCFLLALTG